MSDLLKRISDYFVNDYKGDDKTTPTMEITVDDLRYIANMNVERCRAEAELRNLKYNKRKDDVCEYRITDKMVYASCNNKQIASAFCWLNECGDYKYCPYCGKRIKVIGD